ncbi:restriction endonuclease subunit S [Synechococcus sp. J7-Johnson]|uniref:restriction endonuclease subunit S n=1 Tax=Synechococcus sp. J7-Johnson TaxID=2823737 RepID=UPI0020CDFD47|nr:restriction endonuclease subunit S [Synechococcus sp. J7-Johnson]MCP9841905.1 restriction endonuclease subunit S [Synechococcus sp. J7-Johnson]
MEEQGFPQGWCHAEIGELCELRNGRAFKSADWKETGVPIVRIQNLNNPNAKFNYYQGPIDERNRLQGGELLFAWSGTPGTSFGAHVWGGGEAVLNQHIFRVDYDDGLIDKRFFRFAINQKLNELIDNAHGGVGLRHVTKGKFEKTKVAVPPFNEQHRIAAKLDTTLASVEACRQRLDGVAAILKRFRQAVLAAATSGELTREWREERAEPSWDTKALGQCGAVTGGITKNSSRIRMDQKKPYLRVANVYRNRLDLDDIAVVGVTEAEYLKTVLRAGDLLIVEGNGSLQQVGRVAIWQDDNLDCVHQNHLIRWRSYSMEPKWALYWLMSPIGRELLEKRAQTSTGLHTLSVSKVSGIPISTPSLSEQQRVIDIVDEL